MSHFTVLVVCPADTTGLNVDDRIEKALRPFCEHVDSTRCFAEFFNVTEECRQRYEEEGTERIAMPDGRLLSPWDDEFRQPALPSISYGKHEPPKDLERRIVSFRELYPTLEEFITSWCGYSYYEEEAAFGFYQNPNAKWDWWVIGGRWQGMLTAKPDASVDHLIFGEPGVFGARGDEYRRPDGRFGCDGCRKSDLDYAWERERNVEASKQHWEQMAAEGKQDEISQRFRGNGSGDSASLADILKQIEADHPFSTFAVLKNGDWFEQGQMGWFASVRNQKPAEEWSGEFCQIWDEIPDDNVVVIVDCHI